MQRKSRILIDQSHSQAWTIDLELAAEMNPANPAAASYANFKEFAESAGFEVVSHSSGMISETTLQGVDVLEIAFELVGNAFTLMKTCWWWTSLRAG